MTPVAEPLGQGSIIGCWPSSRSSIQAVGSVSDPGADVLAHGGEHDAKEPTVAAGGASFAEMEVILLALDRAFGTGAGVFVEVPENAISGNQGVKAIVLLGVGVDDTTVG